MVERGAKGIKFLFSPEEVIEHEKKLYHVEKRYTYEYIKELQTNFIK